MRKLVALVAVLLMSPHALLAAGEWRDEIHVFVALPATSNDAVANAIESALAPLKFKRDRESQTQHPINLLKDLVAIYEAGTYANASVFQAMGEHCFYISVNNYGGEHADLSTQARAEIEKKLRASFGDIAFFSDTNCKNAL